MVEASMKQLEASSSNAVVLASIVESMGLEAAKLMTYLVFMMGSLSGDISYNLKEPGAPEKVVIAGIKMDKGSAPENEDGSETEDDSEDEEDDDEDNDADDNEDESSDEEANNDGDKPKANVEGESGEEEDDDNDEDNDDNDDEDDEDEEEEEAEEEEEVGQPPAKKRK